MALFIVAAPLWPAESPRSLPAFFLPNVFARSGDDSTYLAKTPAMTAAFSPSRARFRLQGGEFQVRYLDSSPQSIPEATQPSHAHVNFLVGRDEHNWRRDIPAFGTLVYRDLYPGITLRYSAIDGTLKSEWTVNAGADSRAIRLAYSAIASIASDGSLHLRQGSPGESWDASRELIERRPEIYQLINGERHEVPGRYRLIDDHTVGFEIDAYDPSRELVIDPVISYSTYLGGSGMGAVTGIAIDSGGNAYVTGWTEALNLPIVGAAQAANAGSVDAFVAKFNPAGTALLYATYIGGRGDDRGSAIAVDSSGQAHVTGSTASANFPLVNSLSATLVGSRKAFVLRLNSVGNALTYSTYLGGTAYEAGTAIALDSSANDYVTGDTQSVNFPVSGAVQSSNAGGFDAFVTKINSAGAIVFSTYLGGAGNEHAGGIAIDASSNVYVAGGTYSTNFPTLGSIQSANGGNQDAFLTKLAASGAQILYSTYLGGAGTVTGEQANAITIDGSGNAYIAGVTNSTNFPTTAGAYQVTYNGFQDAFVAKINAAGNALTYSTYLGGTSFDWANGIRVDSSGNAYIAGYTSSFDFAISGGVQAGFGGMYDAFVTKLSASGSTLLLSTYFGGSGSDTANAIAVDGSGNMFVAGQTTSLNFPLQSAIQSANNGGNIGWAARLGVTAPPTQTPSAVSVTPTSGSGNTVTLTAQFSDTGGAGALTSASLLVNTGASTGFACYLTYVPSTQTLSLANDDPASGSLAIAFGGGTQQNSQCVISGTGASATVSGSTLTLTVPITFLPGFAGSKGVFLNAADSGANTGWVSKGTWTVTIPPAQPSADTVSPNGGSGSSQTFTLVYSDIQSAANLTGMAVLFQTSVTTPNACYVVYDRNQGTVALIWDSGLGSSSRSINSTTPISNSQCTLGAASAQISGLSLILTVSLTFTGPFTGTKNIYMYASEGALNTGWVQRGTFSVLAGGVPVVGSVVPGSGSGPAQRFTFTVSDPGGSGFLTGMAALISSTFNTNNACSLVYDRATNVVSLSYDNAANGSSPVAPGSNTAVANSQCTLRGANTTVTYTATQMIVTMDLSFNATFFGTKNIYLYAAESTANSGWSTVGSWAVTGGAPTADSVTPASGAGSSPSFTFSVSDSVSQANISGLSMLFTSGSPGNLANACYLVYDRAASTIGLYNDAASAISSKGIGSSATLQNSRCAVGYTVMTTSGNSVLFTINLAFKPAFNGAKSVYLQANEPSINSGWVLRGSWTVQ
ncbi:MAG: SBBP repeat-containing protein [Bryobacteraceae bacterium]